MTDPTPTAARPLLSGDLPVYVVHRSHQHASHLGRVLPAIANDFGDDLELGVTMNLPFYSQAQVTQFFAIHSKVPIRIADPSLFAAAGAPWPSDPPPARKKALVQEYMRTVPERPGRNWVKHVMDLQVQVGASVLLSANGWVEAIDARTSLARAMQFADESADKTGNFPFMVSLTLDAAWLSDPRLRRRLLQEIVESNHRNWYLRVLWPPLEPPYSQLRDAAILGGYRELAATCAAEDKVLILPNTSLTGWIATALGATGFSTGMSGGERSFTRYKEIKIPGGRSRIARIFDPTLLHTIEFSEYRRLSAFPGHLPPANDFIDAVLSNGHEIPNVGCHYVYEVARLQASLHARRPAVAARRSVRAAEAFIDGLTKADQPSGANRPQHLSVWNGLL